MNMNTTAVKSNDQITQVREACRISSEFHRVLMEQKWIGKKETDIQKQLNQLLSNQHNAKWAYNPLVGAGERGMIIHADPTVRKIAQDDLILVDAGISHQGWASDITRTWPAGKRFSEKQKTIYEIVLTTQTEVIKKVRPGRTLVELHEYCCHLMTEKLLSKGLLKSKNLKDVFPHKTSHWIGRDVHDKCAYAEENGESVRLAAGMLFTVEPGLYFDGIGVRIEDVILVTERGHEVLSNSPKEIEELEHLRGKH